MVENTTENSNTLNYSISNNSNAHLNFNGNSNFSPEDIFSSLIEIPIIRPRRPRRRRSKLFKIFKNFNLYFNFYLFNYKYKSLILIYLNVSNQCIKI